MATPPTGAGITLRLERSIAATPAKVFEAWTRAESIARWFAPSNDFEIVVHAIEPRVGGAYRIEMRPPAGDPNIVTGTFRELTSPSRIVFTWAWERPDANESLVTVTIQPDGQGSRLVLLHERFANTEERDKHNQGWEGCLARLPKALG